MPVIIVLEESNRVTRLSGLLEISCLLHSQKDIFKLLLIFGFAALILFEFPTLYPKFDLRDCL